MVQIVYVSVHPKYMFSGHTVIIIICVYGELFN